MKSGDKLRVRETGEVVTYLDQQDDGDGPWTYVLQAGEVRGYESQQLVLQPLAGGRGLNSPLVTGEYKVRPYPYPGTGPHSHREGG